MFQNKPSQRFEFDPSVTPHEEKTLSGHSYGLYALTVLSDGRLASGSVTNRIKLWSVSSGKCEVTLSGHDQGVLALTVLSDDRLASGSQDETIKLWNVSSGLCEVTLSGHSSWVSALTVLSDGRLASGSFDSTIKLWNVSSGLCEVTLPGYSSYVYALTVLSDGRLVSGSSDGTIKLWNMSSGLCESTLWEPTLSLHGKDVYALTVLSDGRLASGSGDKTIKLWNVSSGKCEVTLSGHSDSVKALALLSDGRLASGGGYKDSTIKLWNVSSGLCEVTLSGHNAAVNALTVLSDGRLASGSFDKTVKLWSVGLTLKLASPIAEATTQNQQPITAIETIRSKNNQKENNFDKKIEQAQEAAERAEAERLAQEQKAREERDAEERRKVEQARIAKEKAEQEERDRKEREAKEIREREEQVRLAKEKEAATPKSQLQRLRELWDSLDDILKEYEALINLVPNDGVNYRERGEYYVYKAKKSKIVPQQKAFYKKALIDFEKAIECNAFDDVSAEYYQNVKMQLEQIESAGNIPPKKIFSPDESSHSTSSSQDASSIKNITSPSYEDHWKIAAHEIARGLRVGKGAYGEVFSGKWRYQEIALKMYHGTILPERLQQELAHEVTVMKRLRCLYLVSFYGVMKDQNEYGIVLEFCSGGSLYQMLHDAAPLPWLKRTIIAQDIARGLAFLHASSIVHADLKSLNVLLTENHRAKITDFGLSEIKSHISSTSTVSSDVKAGGTLRWMAPELLSRGQKSSKASDVYALGMTFWEVITRKLPYAEGDNDQVRGWIKDGEKEHFPRAADACPAHWKNLITQCWQEKEDRPSAETVVEAVMNWPMTESGVQKPTSTVWAGIESLNSQDVPSLSSAMSFFDAAKETKLNVNNVELK